MIAGAAEGYYSVRYHHALPKPEVQSSDPTERVLQLRINFFAAHNFFGGLDLTSESPARLSLVRDRAHATGTDVTDRAQRQGHGEDDDQLVGRP